MKPLFFCSFHVVCSFLHCFLNFFLLFYVIFAYILFINEFLEMQLYHYIMSYIYKYPSYTVRIECVKGPIRNEGVQIKLL